MNILRLPILSLILFVAGCGGTSDYASPLDAEDFVKKYSASPTDYKGKQLTIKGLYAAPTFAVAGSEDLEKETISLEGGITCQIAKDSRKDTKRLKPAQAMTIRGKCVGLVSGGIQMENCTIVK
jgi:hypothetical protein